MKLNITAFGGRLSMNVYCVHYCLQPLSLLFSGDKCGFVFEIFDIQKYPVSAKKNSQIMNCK